ncbi:MAG: NADH-quinone oxidoreductase subunit N [Verrucomicrobia bacterium]|nr:NADH-quinone oxidoreductase subunit N [Verrucomicrobiota bacterium]
MTHFAAIGLELAVAATGLAVLLLDLWVRPEQRRWLTWTALLAVGGIFVASFALTVPEPARMFGGLYVLDELALFFKRFFLLAALLVLVVGQEFADRFSAGHAEYSALTLFALTGMMFAASANDFVLLFVALELVTITFYVLTSFQRRRVVSLEAGVKYLILGALSTGFLVYGLALIFGAAGTMNFEQLAASPPAVLESRLLTVGLLLVLVGLAFKIAAVPFQFWAPDVYEGAPLPTTAFLAVGSKAAGIVLLLRVWFVAAPALTSSWARPLLVVTALTLLYGVLCAIPQRSLKRLMAYSSIANAGFLLLGFCSGSAAGVAAVLFYLGGYLFAVLAIFLVATLAWRGTDSDAIADLAGLAQRSPLLAGVLTLGLVSLAGVPPLAGFFGKFLLLKSVLASATLHPGLYAVAVVALLAAVISLYYYFGVVRVVYWGQPAAAPQAPILLAWPARAALGLCVFGLLWLGCFPANVLNLAQLAAQSLPWR